MSCRIVFHKTLVVTMSKYYVPCTGTVKDIVWVNEKWNVTAG